MSQKRGLKLYTSVSRERFNIQSTNILNNATRADPERWVIEVVKRPDDILGESSTVVEEPREDFYRSS